MLLERDIFASKAPAGGTQAPGFAPSDEAGRVPHYIYSRRYCELRLVTDVTPHADPYLSEGMAIGSAFDGQDRKYTPHFYVDTFSLLRRHAAPLSADLDKPHPVISVKLVPISLGRHRIMTQLSAMFATVDEKFGLEEELDEVRELMSHERIYRFVLMQLISLLHVLFDFLAFKNDIGFWKGRETMGGLSSRSVISSAAQTLVIYLYLLDSPNVNSIVLATYTVSTALEFWKVARVLRIMRATRHRTQRMGPPPRAEATPAVVAAQAAPVVVLAPSTSSTPTPTCDAADGVCIGSASAARSTPGAVALEAATERFDEIATRTLGVGLAPLVGGWAIYALVYYPHSTWYSWVISSLADSVYLFGFISMTPQLFINYKLKSVAHMPWRVMAYKAFNTFIDDVFALMVAMPTMHRIACLRDDVVFFIFLYQRWLYPVDKTRPNEYGIAYEK